MRPPFISRTVLLLLAAAQPVLGGQEPAIDYATAMLARTVSPARVTGTITLDGVLDESSWTGVRELTGFIQNEPREGQPATHDTGVRVIYDEEALYFGVFARDDQPSSI